MKVIKTFFFKSWVWILKHPLISATIGILLILTLNIFSHIDEGILKAIKNCYIFFIEHFWLEILSGIVIWILLESQFDRYSNMPRDTYERDYVFLGEKIAISEREICILDNEINCYYEKMDEFHNKLEKALTNHHDGENIRILLLHPGSEAAQQRRNDLFNLNLPKEKAPFDIYIEMRDGLKKLQHSIEKLNSLYEKKKILVRLFNSTHSLTFISWDESINFSIIPPDNTSDNHTFGTLINTPLAVYYKKYFNNLWENKNSINLENYQYVVIIDNDGKKLETLINKKHSTALFYWGADSSNHNVPAFISSSTEEIPDSIDKSISKNMPVQILHNNQIRWAKLYEINRKNIHPGETTLYSFAKEQIYKQHVCNIGDQRIFKIEYLHSHRINLKEGNYVKKHLTERGYCHVPRAMYETKLGMRVRNMLVALYSMFEKFDEYSNCKEAGKLRRVIITYSCSVYKSEITVQKIENDKIDLNYSIEKNDSISKQMEKFLESTIKSDIDSILGKYETIGNEIPNSDTILFRNQKLTFKVKAHLLQVLVNSKFSKVSPQDESYQENMADFTVLHFAGKKNIIGGIAELVCLNNTLKTSNIIKYNLTTPLDAIFIQKTINLPTEKKDAMHSYSLELKSDWISYFPDEAIIRTSNEIEYNNDGAVTNEPINHSNEKGLRNIVAIEIFKENT